MSTNISKQKREDLLNKIKEIRAFISSAPQDENTGNLLSYLSELEKDVNGKKYGLVFEEHREEIDEILDTHTPVLTENKDLFIDNGGKMNFLIEGDNLASLKLLEKTHKGKIDVIYIDPPYNTGNQDFIYDDRYIEKTDLFKHSKWLSFMEKRLKIAYRLLSEAGYIFISIDDNEIAPLTLLCDKIFGEHNHINTITINMNSLSGVKMTHAVNGKRYPAQKEYMLLYKRSNNPAMLFIDKKHKEKWDKEYNLIIPELQKGQFELFNEMNDVEVNKILADMHLQSISSFAKINNLELTEKWLWENAYRIFGTKSNRPLAKRIKDKLFQQQIVCYTNNDGNNRFFRSDFNREARDPRIELVQAESNAAVFLSDNWIDISNDGGVAQEGYVIFPNGKKPLSLITRVLEAANNKNSTVLDFFAGSGTTGHAVMKLNAEDGGNRKFILCTNNENNICREVTYERIKRVIDKENYSASLKYYKIDYIPISDRMYYEYADELLLDCCYLYTLDDKFTESVKMSLGKGALDAYKAFLKPEHRAFTIISEYKTDVPFPRDAKFSLKVIYKYFEKKYHIESDCTKNKTKLEAHGYIFSDDIVDYTKSGSIATLSKDNITELNNISIHEPLNTHKHGKEYHHCVAEIGYKVNLDYNSTNTIMRKLFLNGLKCDSKILMLDTRDLYAFIINNKHNLVEDVRDAMADEGLQLMLTLPKTTEKPIGFPLEIVFTYDGTSKSQMEYHKNVYKSYLSSAEKRSMPEKLFEKYCENSNGVDWFYKNGDNGNEYFSIVYTDNFGKQKSFYPDYIVSDTDGKVWIIETKGGFTKSGDSEDIDKYTAKKFGVLKRYMERYKLCGGIVRQDKQSGARI